MTPHNYLPIGIVSFILFCTPKHLAELQKEYVAVGQERIGEYDIEVYQDLQGNCDFIKFYNPEHTFFADPPASPTLQDVQEIAEKYDCKQHNLYK